MMMAVAGRTCVGSYAAAVTTPTWVVLKLVEAPVNEGLDYMKKGSVTVGRAGRLSVHTLDERALGMRETECPPSCMHRVYRPRRVVS
jgi:hypothetical protein